MTESQPNSHSVDAHADMPVGRAGACQAPRPAPAAPTDALATEAA